MGYFLLVFTACGLTVIGHLGALKLFPRLKLLDFPERYGLKRARLPYPTGIIAVIVFLILFDLLLGMRDFSVMAFFGQPLKQSGLIAGIVILAITCFIDDRRQLPFSRRLAIQTAVALLIFATGSRIYTITSPFGGFLKLDAWTVTVPVLGPLPVLSGLFTLLWLGLTMNALNWFDGIPGQVSVLSAISFLMLACLALLRTNQYEIAMLGLILAGIALGCALFDFPPPRVLMGDTGSMFFGLMLGILGIYQGGKVATIFLALGIPLLDAIFVVIRRMWNGHSPFRGNEDHLHHRLLKKGWSPQAIVLLTAALGSAFGITALFLDTAGKGVAIGVLILVMAGLTYYTGEKKGQ